MKKRGLRLSIAGMLGAILFFGLVFAALAKPGGLVAILFPTATNLILLGAVLAAWMGSNRPFWRGFALFGVGSLFVTNLQHPGTDDFGPRVSDLVAEAVFPRVHKDIVREDFMFDQGKLLKDGEVYHNSVYPNISYGDILESENWKNTTEYESFRGVILNFFAILYALAGGGLAHVLTARQSATEAHSPEVEAS